jgi:hypothetical protein
MTIGLRLLAISEDELEALRKELHAKLDIYRGRNIVPDAIVDTVQYTRSPTCDDLAEEAEFAEYIADYESASVDLLFDDPAIGEVRARVSTLNGSIWFRNAVPAHVIDEVLNALLRVKGSIS